MFDIFLMLCMLSLQFLKTKALLFQFICTLHLLL